MAGKVRATQPLNFYVTVSYNSCFPGDKASTLWAPLSGFSLDKVPQNLDVIVIGSGLGGLTAAATLAKAGKKVLVLEQHSQAGGCCHTYIDKGFEFDVGKLVLTSAAGIQPSAAEDETQVCPPEEGWIFRALGSSPGLHYIGQLHENGLLRIAFDQISEGQLEFQKLRQHFDTLRIGLGEDMREYTILSGKTEMKEHLLKQFPDDTEAIEKFFHIMKVPGWSPLPEVGKRHP